MACKAKAGQITIDPNFQNNDRDALKHFNKGEKIEVTTLEKLVTKYKLHDAVLKVDCEGYEYEIIENASANLLKKFKTIVIEYHYGFKTLEEKLKKSGFTVTHTAPFYMKSVDDKVNVLCGFVQAERIS
jgi:hypothetical protein